MRTFAFISALIFAIIVSPLGARGEESLLRVLTYNIHHGEGIDGRLDLERIASVVKTTSPDLVALQEVDRNTRRTGNVDQPAELARLTGMHVAFERNISFEGGEYGNAILSRWQPIERVNHSLPLHNNGEQRGALTVEVRPLGLASPVVFIGTHLDHRPDDTERMASAKQIKELAKRHETRPMILAGDLNATPENRVIAELRLQWTFASENEMPTIPVAKPTKQIDYIACRPAHRWKVRDARVLDETVASDHRPLLAILELLPEEK